MVIQRHDRMDGSPEMSAGLTVRCLQSRLNPVSAVCQTSSPFTLVERNPLLTAAAEPDGLRFRGSTKDCTLSAETSG